MNPRGKRQACQGSWLAEDKALAADGQSACVLVDRLLVSRTHVVVCGCGRGRALPRARKFTKRGRARETVYEGTRAQRIEKMNNNNNNNNKSDGHHHITELKDEVKEGLASGPGDQDRPCHLSQVEPCRKR